MWRTNDRIRTEDRPHIKEGFKYLSRLVADDEKINTEIEGALE